MTSTLKTDKIEGVTASGTVQMPAGMVIQTVQTVGSSGRQTYTSTSFFDLVTVSITPKFSTSKILVSAHTSITIQNTAYVETKIVRDSTDIFSIDTQSGYVNNSVNEHSVGSASGEILDSPSTTSATTYKLQMKMKASGNILIDGQPVITVMEIAQ